MEPGAPGPATGTIQAYRRSLTRFYQALPPDKRVGRDTLSRWRDDLLAQATPPGR